MTRPGVFTESVTARYSLMFRLMFRTFIIELSFCLILKTFKQKHNILKSCYILYLLYNKFQNNKRFVY